MCRSRIGFGAVLSRTVFGTRTLRTTFPALFAARALTVAAFTVLFAGGVPAFGALFVFLGALSVARPVPVAVAWVARFALTVIPFSARFAAFALSVSIIPFTAVAFFAAFTPVGSGFLFFVLAGFRNGGRFCGASAAGTVVPVLAFLCPVAAASVAALAFGAVAVEACDAVLLRAIGRFFELLPLWLLRRQLIDLLAGAVQRYDLLDAGDGKRHHVGHRILAAAEGHGTGQDVGFDQVIFAVESLERFPQTGELLAGVHVGVVFVGEAALEFRALSGQFLGVEGDLLHTGRVGRHTREIRDPRCATQFAAAGSDAADASRFLAGADLFHFDADVKPFGEDLD